MRPTGKLHLGHLVGALENWKKLQSEYDCYFMVADWHALMSEYEHPAGVRELTTEMVADWIAAGIDPQRAVIFRQSDVPEHLELYMVLSILTPLGWVERVPTYKEQLREVKGRDLTTYGFLGYPVLQAADILLYHPDVVPVGEDQLQHLELTRTLARRFNNRFGKTFKEPRAFVIKETARVMALDDPARKMSKSAANTGSFISLLDSPEEIHRKVKSAVTDSGNEIRHDLKAKPAISNLINIYSAFSELNTSEIEKKYSGSGYAEFKKDLGKLLVMKLEPIQKKYLEFAGDKNKLIKTLSAGAKKAALTAKKTLQEAKTKVGFIV